jgi:hypothetical protein
MTTVERIIAYGVILVMLVIGVPWYFEHRGAAECKAADNAVVATAEIHNTQVEATQSAADATAEKTLNAALSDPVDNLPSTAGLQPQASAGPMSCPRSHPAPSLAAPAVRVEPQASVVQPDWHTFEQSDVQDGHDADAQVIYLQGLLLDRQKLCGGQRTQ